MTSTKQLVKLIIADSYRPLWQVLKIYAGIMVLVAVAIIHAVGPICLATWFGRL